MKKEDIKVGQKVSFYFSGAKYPNDVGSAGSARVVYGIIYKIHRVNIEIWENIGDGIYTFYKKPDELTLGSFIK